MSSYRKTENFSSEMCIKQRVNETTQKIIIPNSFALYTSITAYIIIGLTSSFNSISIYCSYLCRLFYITFYEENTIKNFFSFN